MLFLPYPPLLVRLLVLLKNPVGEITAVSSEEELVRLFGKPNGSNFETFFTASNFLQYGNALRVVRAQSAVTNAMSGGSGLLIKSDTHYQDNYSAGHHPVESGVLELLVLTEIVWVYQCVWVRLLMKKTLGGIKMVTVGEDAAGATTVDVDSGGC